MPGVGLPAPGLTLSLIHIYLLTGARKPDEVLIFIAWLSEEHCGLVWPRCV